MCQIDNFSNELLCFMTNVLLVQIVVKHEIQLLCPFLREFFPIFGHGKLKIVSFIIVTCLEWALLHLLHMHQKPQWIQLYFRMPQMLRNPHSAVKKNMLLVSGTTGDLGIDLSLALSCMWIFHLLLLAIFSSRVLTQFAFNLSLDWELPRNKRRMVEDIKRNVGDMLIKYHLFSWDLWLEANKLQRNLLF